MTKIDYKNESKLFNKWRKRAYNRLPEISSKVFALRNKHYLGCGFHWSLEKTLGYCITHICNYDRSYNDWSENSIIQIKFEGLMKDIKDIEKRL